MKNKIILIVSFLCIPVFTHAYYSDEKFRLDIMDTIRNNNFRQQQQDILDEQRRKGAELLNDYNRTTNNISREYYYKLREMELKEASDARDKAWQKEKQLMDKELELIRKENELRRLEDGDSKPSTTKFNWDQVIDETLKEIEEGDKKEISKKIKKTTPVDTSAGMFDDVILSSDKENKSSEVHVPETVNNKTKFEVFKELSVNSIRKIGLWFKSKL